MQRILALITREKTGRLVRVRGRARTLRRGRRGKEAGMLGHRLTRVLLSQVWVQQGADGGHAEATLQAS